MAKPTLEQFKKLRRSGLSSADIKTRFAKEEETVRQGEQAKRFLEEPWYKQIFSKQFAREIPGATAETVYGTPAKFIASTAEVPGIVKSGGVTSQKTYDLPGIQPFKSYQSEAETTQRKVIEGEKPLASALTPFIEVPLAGLETYMLGKGAFSLTKKGVKAVSQVKTKKHIENVADYIKQVDYKKGKITALTKERVTKKGITRKIVVKPSKRELEIADQVSDIVKPKKGAIRNISAIKDEIENIAVNKVRPLLSKNTKIIPEASLEKSLLELKKSPPPIVTTETRLQNTYDAIIDTTMDYVKKVRPEAGHTNLSIYDARIGLDRVWENQFGKNVFDPDKVRVTKLAVQQVRGGMNQFIADNTLGAGKEFTTGLRKMSNLYTAADNIAESSWRLVGSNAFSRLIMKHPWIKFVPWIGGAYGAFKASGLGGE